MDCSYSGHGYSWAAGDLAKWPLPTFPQRGDFSFAHLYLNQEIPANNAWSLSGSTSWQLGTKLEAGVALLSQYRKLQSHLVGTKGFHQ